MSQLMARSRTGNLPRILLVAVIGVAIAWGLRSHGGQMLDAARAMDGRWLLPALLLTLAHRIINTLGWTMVVWALGCPLPAGTGARIWLTSEACRWLPGSVWAYGSRAALASRAGVPATVAAASLVWEFLLTVLAWATVAGLGLLCWSGPVPPALTQATQTLMDRPWAIILGGAAVGLGAGTLGWRRVRSKWAKLAGSGGGLRRTEGSGTGLAGVYLFHLAMVVLNGLIFCLVLRAAPGGSACPVAVAVTANTIAWLAGMFALFAPGGLVVREAMFGVLLAGFLPAEEAMTVALAWRAVQVAAEVVVTVAVLAGRSTGAGSKWTRAQAAGGAGA